MEQMGLFDLAIERARSDPAVARELVRVTRELLEETQVLPPRARRDDPATSHAAAAQVEDFSNEHYAKIRRALASRDGCTIHEIAELTGLDHVQVARRLKEMPGILATGETRPGPSGRACRIWKRA